MLIEPFETCRKFDGRSSVVFANETGLRVLIVGVQGDFEIRVVTVG